MNFPYRQPLQDIILRLRAMLEDAESFEGVEPVLMELLEPPDVNNVHQSFDFLFNSTLLVHDMMFSIWQRIIYLYL